VRRVSFLKPPPPAPPPPTRRPRRCWRAEPRLRATWTSCCLPSSCWATTGPCSARCWPVLG